MGKSIIDKKTSTLAQDGNLIGNVQIEFSNTANGISLIIDTIGQVTAISTPSNDDVPPDYQIIPINRRYEDYLRKYTPSNDYAAVTSQIDAKTVTATINGEEYIGRDGVIIVRGKNVTTPKERVAEDLIEIERAMKMIMNIGIDSKNTHSNIEKGAHPHNKEKFSSSKNGNPTTFFSTTVVVNTDKTKAAMDAASDKFTKELNDSFQKEKEELKRNPHQNVVNTASYTALSQTLFTPNQLNELLNQVKNQDAPKKRQNGP